MTIDRTVASRYGLNIADVQSVVSAAIGGDSIGETIEGLQRFPINLRYPRRSATRDLSRSAVWPRKSVW